MNTPKPTIMQRIDTLLDWVEPRKQAHYAIPVKERPASFRHAFALVLRLQSLNFYLSGFFEEVLVNPMRAVNNETTMKTINMVDFLLPRLENWMNGKVTDEQLVTILHEQCKVEVMRGSLADLNCTSPMVNMFSVYTYQNFCEIVKLINDSVLAAQKEKDAPDPEPIAPKKRASRVKA